MTKTNFKIGDKVKFKDYSKYQDHKQHDNEEAIVFKIYPNSICVKWSDESTSTAWFVESTKPYLVNNPKTATEMIDNWSKFYADYFDWGLTRSAYTSTTTSSDTLTLTNMQELINKTKKKGIMSILKDIPNKIKKLLSKDLRAMYQLGWIDNELEATRSGIDAMDLLLFEEMTSKLGAKAIKEVARIKKEEKKDK